MPKQGKPLTGSRSGHGPLQLIQEMPCLGPPVERIESGHLFSSVYLVGSRTLPTKKETVKGHQSLLSPASSLAIDQNQRVPMACTKLHCAWRRQARKVRFPKPSHVESFLFLQFFCLTTCLLVIIIFLGGSKLARCLCWGEQFFSFWGGGSKLARCALGGTALLLLFWRGEWQDGGG